jgi:hypothetical protein
MFDSLNIGDRVRTASTVSTLREPAYAVISRIQNTDPADQVRAIFLAATVAAEACKLDPHEEVERAKRMMSDAEGPHTIHIQALRDYAEGELRRFNG